MQRPRGVKRGLDTKDDEARGAKRRRRLNTRLATLQADIGQDEHDATLEPDQSYPFEMARVFDTAERLWSHSPDVTATVTTGLRHIPWPEFVQALREAVDLFLWQYRDDQGRLPPWLLVVPNLDRCKSNYWVAELLLARTAMAEQPDALWPVDVVPDLATAKQEHPDVHLFVYADDVLYSGSQTAASIEQHLDGWAKQQFHLKHKKQAQVAGAEVKQVDVDDPWFDTSLLDRKWPETDDLVVLVPFATVRGAERVATAGKRHGWQVAVQVLYARPLRSLNDWARRLGRRATFYENTPTYFDHKIADSASVWPAASTIRSWIPRCDAAGSAECPLPPYKQSRRCRSPG